MFSRPHRFSRLIAITKDKQRLNSSPAVSSQPGKIPACHNSRIMIANPLCVTPVILKIHCVIFFWFHVTQASHLSIAQTELSHCFRVSSKILRIRVWSGCMIRIIDEGMRVFFQLSLFKDPRNQRVLNTRETKPKSGSDCRVLIRKPPIKPSGFGMRK